MNQHKPRRIRADYDHEVNIKTKENKSFETHCRNISLSGVFVETNHFLSEGESCKIEIVLKQASPPIYLSIIGHVARVEQDGMGIIFEQIDLETYEHLQHLIYYNTEEVHEFVKESIDKPGIKN